ncbi:MAG TPA: ATP-binding protein [Candidatus Scybalocola faecipullorum]|nr:ATP-binding protein [Candidatus Scybalocola faecipullorum]
MDNYIEKMQTKENLCNAYMQKAEDLFMQNEGIHTKEECAYLQKAAILRYEMAQMSVGEERRFQQRKLQDLNMRIKSIVKTINPELYEQMMNKDKDKEDGKAVKSNGAGGSEVPDDSDGEEISADVASWFKDAPRHSFADVSGMAELKERLKDCAENAGYENLKAYLRMKNLHSYFFIGPPGCGKTYIIEAFAHELMDKNYKFLSLVGSDILSRYVGEAEKIVTRLFAEAEKNAPCIVFIDEVDGVCKNRSLPNLPEYAASITTAFLTGYNRINSSDKSIIFIGATNYPNQVDNAMLDRVELIRVPYPDQEARCFAFKKQFEDIIMLEDGFSFDDMAASTEKYNYRDIERLSATIKNMIYKETVEKYKNEKDATVALKKGDYRLTRAMYETAQDNCLPTPKEDIDRALDEWETKFNNGLRGD